MFTSFSTALSALSASATAVDVVGNNLANLKTPYDTWKVRLIEEEFHQQMFNTEGV